MQSLFVIGKMYEGSYYVRCATDNSKDGDKEDEVLVVHLWQQFAVGEGQLSPWQESWASCHVAFKGCSAV